MMETTSALLLNGKNLALRKVALFPASTKYHTPISMTVTTPQEPNNAGGGVMTKEKLTVTMESPQMLPNQSLIGSSSNSTTQQLKDNLEKESKL